MKHLVQFKSAVLLICATVLLGACQGGCSSVPNPHAEARTPEQHAYAVYGEWVIAKEAAAEILEQPQTPQPVREKVADIDRRASPIANSLYDTAQEAFKIRAQIATGQTTEDKLSVVLTNLNEWVTRLEPEIRKLSDAVTGK